MCVHARKGLALPRASHSGEIALPGSLHCTLAEALVLFSCTVAAAVRNPNVSFCCLAAEITQVRTEHDVQLDAITARFHQERADASAEASRVVSELQSQISELRAAAITASSHWATQLHDSSLASETQLAAVRASCDDLQSELDRLRNQLDSEHSRWLLRENAFKEEIAALKAAHSKVCECAWKYLG